MTADTTSCAKKSRGRPKVFDREAALDKAVTLFWQHGYETASLADLVAEATGAKAPTLYANSLTKSYFALSRIATSLKSLEARAQLFVKKSVESALEDYFTKLPPALPVRTHAGWLLYD